MTIEAGHRRQEATARNGKRLSTNAKPPNRNNATPRDAVERLWIYLPAAAAARYPPRRPWLGFTN
jgi:hypothetical protein